MTEEDRNNLNFILSHESEDEMLDWWMSLSDEDRIYALALMEVNRLEVIDNYVEQSEFELIDIQLYLRKFSLSKE